MRLSGGRPQVTSTVHDAHDDDFGVGEAVVQRVVAMEMDAQSCGQSIPTWSDLWWHMRL